MSLTKVGWAGLQKVTELNAAKDLLFVELVLLLKDEPALSFILDSSGSKRRACSVAEESFQEGPEQRGRRRLDGGPLERLERQCSRFANNIRQRVRTLYWGYAYSYS